MDKLNFWETIKAEVKEARTAQKAYNKQVSQINKRLYYLPVIFHTLCVATVAFLLFGIVRFSWYVTWQAEEKPQPVYTCPVAHCTPCSLPETGAN